ncbi:tyrosine-type recombinase/integrase [Parabacteroides distasonis]|uniref:Site-specific recombinase XerD n=1 Tax=Parabacteroides distasonis TaxID=823 RepID=A0A174VYM8_PARDI|nr:phage integrase SAM-like domain-containing protein [Parabacteroides distasonis]CUQ38526.1 Site-specific recombinase XerD [Parabacteroides distasonis]
MAYFKICVRNKRADGVYPIYIRVTHNRKVGYIKTDKNCKSKFVKNGLITDPYIIKDVYVTINKYIDRLNNVNTGEWNVKEVIDYLTSSSRVLSFSVFALEYIEDKRKKGQRGYHNYLVAFNSLKAFLGKDEVLFSDITSTVLSDWIFSMRDSKHKKSSYPAFIKYMFKDACEKYNNYEEGIIRIKGNPFKGVKIPFADVPEKRALDCNTIRSFFEVELPAESLYANKKYYTTANIARDVCMMVFCLIGINTIDLYKLKKENYVNGKLCYNRSKTRDRRPDGAYIEITVPDRVKPLFEKYEGKEDRLFCFSEYYATPDVFNHGVNNKLKKICKHCGLGYISTYSFRHSWATIACNVFDVDVNIVGFCLNHIPQSKVTWGYIKTDFDRIDKINQMVLGYIFSEKSEKSLQE